MAATHRQLRVRHRPIVVIADFCNKICQDRTQSPTQLVRRIVLG